MGCGGCTSKLFLAILSILFWAVAGALIFIGVWIFIGYQNVQNVADSLYILVPATFMIGVGVFLFILGIVGCIGAFKENKCLLGCYFTILLIIFVGMVAGSILAYVRKGDVKEVVEDGLYKGLDRYGNPNETEWTEEIDFVQENLECCGVHNYTDWANTTWYTPKEPYPSSCCKNSTCHYGKNDTHLYTDGCLDKLESEFRGHLAIIAGIGVAFVVIQILGMICSCILICRRKDEVPYIGLNDPQGMRV